VVANWLPATMAAHGCGDLSSAKVRIMAEELPVQWQEEDASVAPGNLQAEVDAAPVRQSIPPSVARRQLEALVLPKAPDQTPHQFRCHVRSAIAAIDALLAAQRARKARRMRGVSLIEFPNGMAILEAYLTIEEARDAFNALDRKAHIERTHIEKLGAESTSGTAQSVVPIEATDITLDSLRADMFVEAIRDSSTVGQSTQEPGVGSRRIAAVIDLPTLLGLADHPGEIPGYGTVSADVARQIARDATWVRWVTDPTTGHLIDAGRRRYVPPTALRDYIAARDGVCRFPGCQRDALTADLDHALSFQAGGETSRANLGALCRRHHRLKTAGTWQIVKSEPDGSCTWAGPTGRHHEVEARPVLPTAQFSSVHLDPQDRDRGGPSPPPEPDEIPPF
jgi:hypothetical protein